MHAPAPAPSAAPAPATLAALASAVEARLRAVLDVEAARWAALDPQLAPTFHALDRLVLGGGKRLRPAFCHWGAVGAGADAADPRLLDAGAALELLHAFALAHDDVMDGSPTRRGLATTHVAFAETHAAGSWRGESRRFGEGMAILVGDLAFVYADRLLAGAATRPEVAEVWHELRIELNVGQYLDLLGTARGDADVERSRRIAHYKSAKYTVERPLHLGAALAGRLDELGPHYTAYGIPLGEAFQLRDDVLGAFGDPSRTGKPVGDDLREGKPTPILATARARATVEQRTLLDRVGRPDLDDDEITAIQEVLVDTGALADAEAAVDRMTGEAVAAAESAPITHDARHALVELAMYLARRDH